MSIPQLNDYALPTSAQLPVNKISWSFDCQHAALLIHDMQNYFLNFWKTDSTMITQVIDNIVQIKEACRSHNIPVFYTAQPSKQSDIERGLLNDMWGPGLNLHADQHQITQLLAPQSNDVVLEKWRYSAFQRSELELMLKRQDKNQLIICGVYAHIGCMTTALDAFMRDIKPFFIADALADFSQEKHLMALQHIASCCGQVMTTQELVEEIKPAKQWSIERLRQEIIPLLDDADDTIDNNDNLLDYGLDSVQIMSLISRWNHAGYKVDFVDMVKEPTLTRWLHLLQQGN